MSAVQVLNLLEVADNQELEQLTATLIREFSCPRNAEVETFLKFRACCAEEKFRLLSGAGRRKPFARIFYLGSQEPMCQVRASEQESPAPSSQLLRP